MTVDIQDPWANSIMMSLEIIKTDAGFRLDLSSSYGLSGSVEAKKVKLRITPGKPTATE